MTDDRVTVVMITYNRCAEALRAIRHICELPDAPAVIVVDNASTDGTANAIASAFAAVRIIRLRSNLAAAGRNYGVIAARTPYVAFCDDDMQWEPGSLVRAADILDQHLYVALVAARVLVGQERRPDPSCEPMARSPLPAPATFPGKRILGFLAGASVVRRDAYLQAGGFNPRFFIGGEEEVFAIDLAAAGWSLAYAEELVVRHVPSAARHQHSRSWIQLRNRIWSAWLRRPVRHAFRETWQAARIAPRDPVARRALQAAFKGLPWAVRSRRSLPQAVLRDLALLDRMGRR